MGEVTDTTAMIVNCLKDGEDIPLCVRRMDEVLQLKVVELSIHVINFLCSSSTLYLARGPDDEVEIKSVLEFSREFPKGG
jgi:hypothetical protein